MEISRFEVLAEFGFRRDPFDAVIETSDAMKLRRVAGMAVESRAMLSVVADRGVGKTAALAHALGEAGCREVRPLALDREYLRIGDIERALVRDLSDEPVRHTREVRARQVSRIVGEAAKAAPVVLVVEEAHRLHGQTLRALKSLRELSWLGRSPLLTVVLVGQHDPCRRRALDEVRLRADTVRLLGLAQAEAREYITATVGRVFDADALEAVTRLPQARNFLDLQEALVSLMARALANGSHAVSALDVFEEYGGGIKEVMRAAGMSLADLQTETGIAKSTLSLVTTDKRERFTDDKFRAARDAVAEVLRRRMSPPLPIGEGARKTGTEGGR